MQYEISRRAAEDIEDIVVYTLEHFGRGQVDEYTLGLYHSFELLKDNPKLGKSIAGGSVRRYVYRMHHIYYEVRDEVIRIAHIRHTSQDLPAEWE